LIQLRSEAFTKGRYYKECIYTCIGIYTQISYILQLVFSADVSYVASHFKW